MLCLPRNFTYLILSFLFFTSIPIHMSTIFSSLLSDNSSLRPQPKTMVADLSLLSLSSKGEANGGQVVNDSAEGAWTWNPNKVQDDDDDDSWEVKAFEEDTSNIMGATWPPRSYTCTFCLREFRSAQALGGHMNVHRKDRARLNRSQFPNPHHSSMSASSSSSPSPLIIPTNQEFAAHGGLCVLYQLPQGNGVFTPSRMNARALDSSSSSFISIPPYMSNAAPYPPNTNLHWQLYPQGNIDRSTQWISYEGQGTAHKGKNNRFKSMDFNESVKEELDLELRLGK